MQIVFGVLITYYYWVQYYKQRRIWLGRQGSRIQLNTGQLSFLQHRKQKRPFRPTIKIISSFHKLYPSAQWGPHLKSGVGGST